MTCVTPRPWMSAVLVAASIQLGAFAPVGRAQETVAPPPPVPRGNPFASFTLPQAWQDEYWSDPDVEAILGLEPEALAALVPEQAGFFYTRCPSCEAGEAEDPLSWSAREPEILTCRSCEATFPNDSIPAKEKDVVPSATIEVRHGLTHSYPYHLVEAGGARYPDERIYLDAKRDDLIRTALAKFALYASVRHREAIGGEGDPKLAKFAAIILLKFAEVYPNYAVHFDHPGQPKFLQPADLKPPYREGFRSAKWDRSGALNVPMNLVIAYAFLRDDPAIVEAGELLGVDDPNRLIEDDLLRSSAGFLLGHPDPHDEQSIYAARGLLTVGLLLGDSRLRDAGLATLDSLARRGFYHDGHWKSADPEAHRRVVGLIDGWFRGIVPDLEAPVAIPPEALAGALPVTGRGGPDGMSRPGASLAAVLPLARRANDAAIVDPEVAEVHQVSWPPMPPREIVRGPTLLGGAGLARLASGEGDGAIDLELRGFADYEDARYDRLAIRLAFGGRTVLGDLDDLGPTITGWERSSAAHNVVIVDGLNQRESPAEARNPAPGSDLLFFAADPSLQVATMSDPRAYPTTGSLYRHTVAVVQDERVRFAIGVFEVHGGHQHDALYHAPPGSAARWRTSKATGPGPRSLLPASITYVPTARVEDGRWFLQAYGAFSDVRHATVEGPTLAELVGPSGPLVRLHLLNSGQSVVFSADAPDPSKEGRGVLILRRDSNEPEPLRSTFVTLYEPPGISGIRRVGRVESAEGTAQILVETDAGDETIVVNSSPGKAQSFPMKDGGRLETDALLVRVRPEGITMAGGTFAEHSGRRVEQRRVEGRITGVVRSPTIGGLGWFETDGPITEPESLAGRSLIISHGRGTSRAWTIGHAENGRDGRGRIVVTEEPGFVIDPKSGGATYYQFPNKTAPGPHRYIVPRIARSG